MDGGLNISAFASSPAKGLSEGWGAEACTDGGREGEADMIICSRYRPRTFDFGSSTIGKYVKCNQRSRKGGVFSYLASAVRLHD